MSGISIQGDSTADGPAGFEEEPADRSTQLSEDELFEVLANSRRRHAVHAITSSEVETHDLGELSERVAAWENGVDVAEVSYDERKRVYTALQQSHLPKLDEAGLITFDKDRGTVDAAPAMEDVEIYLDVVEGNELPWSEYYLGLAGVSVALLGAVWVDAFPFGVLPDIGWFACVVAAFTVSAAVHRYYSQDMKLGGSDVPPELD